MNAIHKFFGFLLCCITLAGTSANAQNIAGTYTGTYTGAESGAVTITIASDNRTVKCDFSGNVFYGVATILPSPGASNFSLVCSGAISTGGWVAGISPTAVGANPILGTWSHANGASMGQGTFVASLVSGSGGPAVIGTSYTGSWYDPAQSGQGFNIEVLGNQVLAYWYVFDDAGNAAWLYGVGPINANTVSMTAYRMLGGRFPPLFNPATTSEQPWGTLSFTFSSCLSGQMHWTTNVSGFGTGSGSMPLTRLTVPSGLTCQ